MIIRIFRLDKGVKLQLHDWPIVDVMRESQFCVPA